MCSLEKRSKQSCSYILGWLEAYLSPDQLWILITLVCLSLTLGRVFLPLFCFILGKVPLSHWTLLHPVYITKRKAPAASLPTFLHLEIISLLAATFSVIIWGHLTGYQERAICWVPALWQAFADSVLCLASFKSQEGGEMKQKVLLPPIAKGSGWPLR